MSYDVEYFGTATCFSDLIFSFIAAVLLVMLLIVRKRLERIYLPGDQESPGGTIGHSFEIKLVNIRTR